jgi:lipopolysaccharide export system permease protein
MRLRPALTTLDRYLLRQAAGTLASVFGIVISLMLFEHLPRLFAIVRLSGRKSYIVVQSMVALLPEYAGVGLLFGLYLAIALTVRRLSLRNELDIVEASGIPASRWMRFPALLTLVVAGLLLLNQGWLMPLGERRLSELGRGMESGQFGFDLEAGKFTDLGNGVTVKFEGVDPFTNELRDVFFHTPDKTFTASRGRLGFDFANHVLVDLENGRTLNGNDGRSLSFSRFHFDSGGHEASGEKSAGKAERRKAMDLPALLTSSDPGDRATGWSRLLWPAFALMIPLLAAVLGKPLRRTSSSLGLMAGLILLVMFTRSTGFVATTGAAWPRLVALGIGVAWLATMGIAVWGERRWGAGYVDGWLLKAGGRLKVRQWFGMLGSGAARRRRLRLVAA